RRSLRQSLHDLRLALGSEAYRLKSTTPRTLRLNLEGASVDVFAFDAAVAHGDPGSLEAAVQLYPGPLLEDCLEAGWLEVARRGREQAFGGALKSLATAALARGEPAAGASYLRRAVAADPYREDLQRALMEALTDGDNPAAALLVYQEFRARLWREMAAKPAD